MKKKPHWFRPIDFLTIALPGLVTAGLLVYALSAKATGPSGWPYGMALVALTFVGIWVRFCVARKQWLDGFRWYPTYGIMFQAEGYKAPSDADMDDSVSRTVAAWAKFFPNSSAIVAGGDVIWCYMRKDLNESPKNLAKMKVNGLTIAGSYTMMVDYDAPEQEFAKTAFEHELGHVIMGHATGNWDMVKHHDFARINGLR